MDSEAQLQFVDCYYSAEALCGNKNTTLFNISMNLYHSRSITEAFGFFGVLYIQYQDTRIRIYAHIINKIKSHMVIHKIVKSIRKETMFTVCNTDHSILF